MPRALAKELREATESRRVGMTGFDDLGSSPSGATASSPPQRPPKGCFCQMGSGFKAVLILLAMVSVTTGVVWWLYVNKFSADARSQNRNTGFRQGRTNLPSLNGVKPGTPGGIINTKSSNREDEDRDLEIDITFKSENILLNGTGKGGTQNEPEQPKVVKTISDTDPDLYMDYEGNLHPVEDLKREEEKATTATAPTTTITQGDEEGTTTADPSSQPTEVTTHISYITPEPNRDSDQDLTTMDRPEKTETTKPTTEDDYDYYYSDGPTSPMTPELEDSSVKEPVGDIVTGTTPGPTPGTPPGQTPGNFISVTTVVPDEDGEDAEGTTVETGTEVIVVDTDEDLDDDEIDEIVKHIVEEKEGRARREGDFFISWPSCKEMEKLFGAKQRSEESKKNRRDICVTII